MEFLRACLFSLIIFAALAIIALLVAGIMMIIYSVVHKSGKKTESGNDAKPVEGKAG
jgi:hypothetical protein